MSFLSSSAATFQGPEHGARASLRPGRTTPKGRDPKDSGDTLIEILIAMLILGIATLSLLAAFATSISASATHRSLATFDTVIRSAAQQAISQIQQQPDPLYESCAPASYYQSGAGGVQFNLPPGYTAQVTQVQYWNGTAFTTAVSDCVPSSPEWIQITVTNSSGQSYTNNFIIDDPYAPPIPADANAYQLVFVTQPGGATTGNNFATQPVIAVEDDTGHVVTTDLSSVTLAITPGTGTAGATLSQYCTGVETEGVVTFSDCSINTAGVDYQLTATDSGLVSAISTEFNVDTQLNTPVITSAVPSSTETSAINVTFVGASNAPGGETYTATACANSGVGFGCVTQSNFSSGQDITGLTAGTQYYVTVTANAPSPLYLSATSNTVGPVMATNQLTSPGTPTLAYGSVPGSIQVTFSTPTPAASGQVYSATACTNAAMTQNCVTDPSVTSGGNFTGLPYTSGSPGASYYVDVTATASSGFLASPPSGVGGPQAVESTLNAPTGLSVAASTTTPGAISVTFTASAGPQAPSSYTLTLCSNAAMSIGCSTSSITPGTTQITGLVQGSAYYAQVTANSPSAAFQSANSSVAGPALATTQLGVPSNVSAAYGTVAGSIAVTFTAPGNASGSQTYTVQACTNLAMTLGCVSNANFTSGANLTGLGYTQGVVGTNYYVTVTSNASSGFFASSPSAAVGPQADTSKVDAPTAVVPATSTTVGNSITVTFTPSLGVAPSSYTATACTNASMTANCITSAIASGGTLSGLNGGSSYYVEVTAVGATGFVNATSSVTATSTLASTQLSAPQISAVTPSTTTAGQLSISFTESGAPGGQTYTATACTNAAMSTGCVTQGAYTSGAAVLGLTAGTQYYVTVTANASVGYIAATSSVAGPALATVGLATPGTPTLGYGTVAGSIAVTVSSAGAPVGQLYTVKACTNLAMTTGCVTDANVASGGNATGLAYVQGSPGTSYYVDAYAQASSGYLQSGTSAVAGPQAATSMLNAPGTPTVASSSTTAGSVVATFTNSSGPTVGSYTATACTNVGMTQNCVSATNYTSGSQLTGLNQGSNYYVQITAVSSSAAYAAANSTVSSSPALATVQLTAPVITSVLPSTTTAGAITVGFTGSSNAPGGQSYTAVACTNAAMTANCVTKTGYTSGAQLTGLTAGTQYYVQLTAVASTGYLQQVSSVSAAVLATAQLATPGTPTLAYGTVAGSIAVTVSSTGAPAGQLFTVKACTNLAMTTGCVTDANVLSGGNATGLAFTPGTAGTNYYVDAYAQASSGYLQSATSAVAGPQADTSSLNAPTNLTVVPSTTTAGALVATFTSSTGTAPSSYTATACLDAGMSTGCVTQTNYTSGTQLTGLTAGSNYYVTITAVSSNVAYASATTAAVGPTLATTQLATPTNVTLAYGTVAGSVAVTFTAPGNASPTQTYTAKACTNAGMSVGCVSNANFTSGSNLTGLAYTQGVAGTNYYVTVTANASSGYLVSSTSAVAGPQADTSELGTPGTPTVASSTQLAGAVTATFSASTGVAPSSYTVEVCTNAGMTAGCLTQTNYTSGAQIQPLIEGTSYYAQITAVSSNAAFAQAVSAVSAGSAVASTQLVAPTISAAAPSATTPGAITVTFTGSVNAPAGQTYTAVACTDQLMTQNCVTQANYTSGAQFTGLSQGTSYYVTITANPSTSYIAATTPAFGPVGASTLLTAPTGVTLAYGTVAGSVAITFTGSSNAPGGQTYTAKACTNVGMSLGCVSNASFTSGSNLTGLAYTQGSAGSAYYVTVTANASTGYIVSSPSSPVAGPQNATSQVDAPGTPTVTSSSTTSGAVVATFTASGGTAPASYSAQACTNAAMTQNCVTQANYTSGAQLTGLNAGSSYYVQITAVGPTGFLSTMSGVSGSAALATTQLTAPTNVTLAYGTVAGSVAITFTGSSNAPGGQTYTAEACTNVGMSLGCVSNASFTSGSNVTGLAYTQGAAGTPYYVTVTANASTGYLAVTTAETGPQNATSQVDAPGTPTVATSTTTAGAVVATFTSSGGVAPASYSAKACTNAGMTAGCVTQANYTSGAQLTGLTGGLSYYVQITAVGASGYVNALSGVSAASAAATTQLNAPTNVTLAYGTVAGSVAITFTGSSNAPGGQTYTAEACTNLGMSVGCVSNATFTSGSNLTGLAYTQGSAGTAYYVTVTANASSGYLAVTTAVTGPQNATSQVDAPGTPTVASSTTTAGAVVATFTASGGTAPASYSAQACTNAGMTAGCVTQNNYTSGAQLTGLAAGSGYFVQVTAVGASGYVNAISAVSASSATATIQLNTPTITAVAPSSTTAGQITITYTGSANAPGGQTYNAEACTNAGMSNGCVTVNGYTSGAQFGGLAAGSSYYVTITAPASANYLAATTSPFGPTLAAVQLNAPTGVTLAYGTVAGSVAITFTGSSNAPGGQTYTAEACTNVGMSLGCVSNASFTSGSNLTGLAYTQGSAGTPYYVTVTANASTGYLVSAASTPAAGPQNATSQVDAPGTPTVASSTTTAGAVVATFTASGGTAPASYTAQACTNAGMSQNCVTQANYTSGAQLTGLTAGSSYFVQITAVGASGYTNAPSAVSASSAPATVQLNAPTGVTLAYGTVAGSLAITFTGSSNAAGGQTYTATACTNTAMNTGCVSNATFTSGSNLTGLAYTQGSAGTAYYVTVTANASTGYLAVTTAYTGPKNATSQVDAPGTPTVASSTTTAGAVTATFTSSGGTAPASYSAEACTNAGMSSGCVTQANYTSGAQMTGLAAGSSYYVQITAVGASGYANALSAVSASSAAATTQLNAPTITAVTASGTTSLKVTFTGSSNAPGGQTYNAKACTNAGMTTGCVTDNGVTSPYTITGLTASTKYYVTITAAASTGYLQAVSAVDGPTTS